MADQETLGRGEATEFWYVVANEYNPIS
jgi:hypothetical protein